MPNYKDRVLTIKATTDVVSSVPVLTEAKSEIGRQNGIKRKIVNQCVFGQFVTLLDNIGEDFVKAYTFSKQFDNADTRANFERQLSKLQHILNTVSVATWIPVNKLYIGIGYPDIHDPQDSECSPILAYLVTPHHHPSVDTSHIKNLVKAAVHFDE